MKTTLTTAKCFALATLVAAGCTAADPPAQMGGTTGTQMGSDCFTRCSNKLTSCGVISPEAGDACANHVCNVSPTDDQLTCLESTACGLLTSSTQVCGFSLGGGGTTTSSGGTTTSSGGMCISLGAGGCNAQNNPSGCCTDAAHPSTVCHANADSSLQCCVPIGQPCTQSSDCCGSADSNGLYKCCPTGLCGAC